VQISCVQCDLRLLFASNCASQSAIIMGNYTNSEMTDVVLCYGSADGIVSRVQALAVVYGKMVLFDREVWIGAKSVRHGY
jgi:hypothetical protein